MRRGSGRFREIAAYKSRTAGSLLRGEVWTHMQFVVSKSSFHTPSSVVNTANTKIRHCVRWSPRKEFKNNLMFGIKACLWEVISHGGLTVLKIK